MKQRVRCTVLLIVGVILPGALTTVNPAEGASPATNGKIAFVSNRDGNNEIYVMAADGSGQINLTNDSATSDVDPAWSPDVRRAACG